MAKCHTVKSNLDALIYTVLSVDAMNKNNDLIVDNIEYNMLFGFYW